MTNRPLEIPKPTARCNQGSTGPRSRSGRCRQNLKRIGCSLCSLLQLPCAMADALLQSPVKACNGEPQAQQAWRARSHVSDLGIVTSAWANAQSSCPGPRLSGGQPWAVRRPASAMLHCGMLRIATPCKTIRACTGSSKKQLRTV